MVSNHQLFVYNPAASKTRILSLWLQLHSLLFNFLSHGKVLEAKIGESKASEPKEAFKGHFVHERLRFIGCMHISKAFFKSMLRSFFYFILFFGWISWNVVDAMCKLQVILTISCQNEHTFKLKHPFSKIFPMIHWLRLRLLGV